MAKSLDPTSSGSPVDGIIPFEASKPADHSRDLGAMLTSACLHAALLVILACWVLPTFSHGTQTLLVSAGESHSYALESIDLSTQVDLDVIPLDDTPVEVGDALEASELQLTFNDMASAAEQSVATAPFVPTAFSEESLANSSSVEGAVDRITNGALQLITAELE